MDGPPVSFKHIYVRVGATTAYIVLRIVAFSAAKAELCPAITGTSAELRPHLRRCGAFFGSSVIHLNGGSSIRSSEPQHTSVVTESAQCLADDGESSKDVVYSGSSTISGEEPK